MQFSHVSLWRWMRSSAEREELQQSGSWKRGVRLSRYLAPILQNDRTFPYRTRSPGVFFFLFFFFNCQRFVGSNLKYCALFLAPRGSSHSPERGSLGGNGAFFYLWCSPNSYKTSPSHAVILNSAAHASWWRPARCLWRSTKACFDIWDDKKAHTLRSCNRHLEIVLRGQTWCSALTPPPTHTDTHTHTYQWRLISLCESWD